MISSNSKEIPWSQRSQARDILSFRRSAPVPKEYADSGTGSFSEAASVPKEKGPQRLSQLQLKHSDLKSQTKGQARTHIQKQDLNLKIESFK